jgi:hypothetical protein
MKYRWIRKITQTYKNRTYLSYAVSINDKHLYSSSVLQYCEEYVLRYAQKHGINYCDILKSGKHKRIKNESKKGNSKL